MFCSEWIAVAPGTVLTGRMTVVGQADGLFSCTCAFDGFPGTELTAEELPSLSNCSLTLEAYDIGPNAPYPGVAGSDFNAVNISTGAGVPQVNWVPNGNAVIVTDGANAGDIRVIYPAAGT
jgi:hypothetical protein